VCEIVVIGGKVQAYSIKVVEEFIAGKVIISGILEPTAVIIM